MIIYGSNGSDPNLDGTATGDLMFGWANGSTEFDDTGNDTLRGLGGNDFLYGGGGNDVLIGGTGIDTMQGGTGDDIYYVDIVTENVVEFAGEGTDTVVTTVASCTLRAQLENLVGSYSMASDVDLRGNNRDNMIMISDFVSGFVTMRGRGGDDLLFGVDWTGAASAPIYNKLFGGDGDDKLSAGKGNNAYNEMMGEAGNDVLVMSAVSPHNTVAKGGAGDDTYVLGSSGDQYQVAELAGEGIDTVFTTSITYILKENFENLRALEPDDGPAPRALFGNGLDNLIVGTGEEDQIVGYAGNDNLRGSGGNDFLSGFEGADQLTGGKGRDWFNYYTVLDSSPAGGADTILDFQATDGIFLGNVDANANRAGLQNFAFDTDGILRAGDLRIVANGSGWTIEGHVNNDGVADLVIHVAGTSVAPVESQFDLMV